MRLNRHAVARFAAVLLLLPVVLVAGCEQRNKQQNQVRNNPPAAQENVAAGGRVRLRVVCADDIQKYCANADRKRRCLRENIDKLSDTCKAALARRGGGRRQQDGQSQNGDE